MCFVLYMASNQECPLIPWDENDRHFCVTKDDADAERARVHFSKPNLYYLGSDIGCGCNFRQSEYSPGDGPEMIASQKDNHERLHRYLAELLQKEDSIELYGCWSGDEEQPPEQRRTVTIDDLAKEDFYFSERQLTVVVKKDNLLSDVS